MKITSTNVIISINLKHEGVRYQRCEEVETDEHNNQTYYGLNWFRIRKDKYEELSIEKNAALELMYENIDLS